jgi:hypothetical protein
VAEIRFQLDEHVAKAVAQALRRRGVDVVTADEAGLLTAPDVAVLDRARASGRVLVTHDADFLRLHAEGRAHAGIAYCPQGTRTIGQLTVGLVLIHDVLEPDEMVGRVEFLRPAGARTDR